MVQGSCLAGQVAGPHGGRAGGEGLARTSGQTWHVRVGAALAMAAPHMALGGAFISTALTRVSGGEPGKRRRRRRRRHGPRSPRRLHFCCNYRLEQASNVKFAVAENLLTEVPKPLVCFSRPRAHGV